MTQRFSPLSKSELGDIILSYLSTMGVEYIFGVPGGGIEPLYNALARSERNNSISSVVSRHECGAVFMAEGYARESGKLGVCCATAGPGATNMLTGVSSAYSDGTPLLVITAQTSLATFGRGALQESSCVAVDTVAMFKSCTRYNTLVSHPDQLEHKLLTAISTAFSNTPGPVHLSIPLDILRSPATQTYPKVTYSPFTNHDVMASPQVMNQLTNLLEDIDHAVLLIGQGCQSAVPEILQFAENRQWPIVTTPMGKGLISPYHPLYFGVFGLAGHQSAYNALTENEAKTIIAVGTPLDEVSTHGWDKNTIISERLIHIDSNPEHLASSYMAKLRVLGAPSLIFKSLNNNTSNHVGHNSLPMPEELYDQLPQQISFNNLDKCTSNSSLIKPHRLLWEISRDCPINTSVAVDIGNSFLWGLHYWQGKISKENKTNNFQIGIGFAAMGWSIGASIGIALASPNKPVVCITGDGSILMNGQEVTVANEKNLNIIYIILNDSALGMVKHGQHLACAESIGCDLPNANYAAMAKALGVKSIRIDTLEDWQTISLPALFEQPGPYVIDVIVDAEECPPLGMRVRVLSGQ